MVAAKIFVAVEDPREAQKIYGWLHSSGYDVFSMIPWHDEFLTGLEDIKPDIILMDVVLKCHNELTDVVNKFKDKLDIPVIYLSPESALELESEMEAIPNSEYLHKPLQKDLLKITLNMAEYKQRMAELLKATEKRYRLLIENADDPITIVSKEGEFLLVNPSAAHSFGTFPEKLLGKTMWDLFPPIIADRQINNIKKVIKTGMGQVFEEKTIINGNEFWYSTNIQPMPQINGEIKSAQLIARDITRIKELENFFSGTINDMLTLVAVLKPNGEIVFVNNTAINLIDQDLEQLIGTHFADSPWWSLSDELRAKVRKDIDLCARGKTLRHELEIFTNNGPVWIEYSMHPLLDDNGEIQYLVPEGRDISSIKEMEQNLRSEKSKLRNITENSPFGLLLIDPDGNYQYINSNFQEMCGYSIEDIPNGKEWFRKAYPDPDIRHKVIKTWVDDFRDAYPGTKKPRTFPVCCNDGKIKSIHFEPVLLDNGQYLMTARDVTHQEKVKKALETSEQRFRTVAKSAADAIIITNSQDRIVFSNNSVDRIFEYAPIDIQGEFLDILIPGRYQQQFWQEIGEQKTHTRGGMIESYGLRKDGSEFPLELSLNTWEVEKERYTTIIIRDTTRRKLTEFKLKMQEEIFHLMARNIEEVFWIIDPLNGQLIYMSPSFEKIWGINVQALYQSPRSWIESIHVDDRDDFVSFIFGSHNLERTDIMSCRVIRPDGKIKWIKTRAFPVINENKEIYRRIGIAMDITHQRKIETELKGQRSEN